MRHSPWGILVPLPLASERPDPGYQEEASGEVEDCHRKPHFDEVGKAVAAYAVDIGVSLIADGGAKAGGSCDAGADDKGTGIDAQALGKAEADGGHDDDGGVVRKEFGEDGRGEVADGEHQHGR